MERIIPYSYSKKTGKYYTLCTLRKKHTLVAGYTCRKCSNYISRDNKYVACKGEPIESKSNKNNEN